MAFEENGLNPSVFWTTACPSSRVSMTSSTVPLAPAAKIDANATSATPTMSAAEVTAVRPGWRTVFSRAKRPVTPKMRSIGRPTTEAIGATSLGESSATPRNVNAAPMPRSSSAVESPSPANRPTAMPARPSAVSSTDSGNASRDERLSGRATPSRSAATGGTRVARRAGARVETSVTRTPTSIDTQIVRPAITMPEEGSSKPTLLKSAFRPAATPIPSTSPAALPRTPSTAPSASTERSTCPREAPSVRSSANSRARWATVMENVLKMMNAPTKSAMPAKASSAVRRKPSWSRMSAVWLAASACPVRTWTVSGSAARSRSTTASGSVPRTTAMSISSNFPSLPVTRCASVRVMRATAAPP